MYRAGCNNQRNAHCQHAKTAHVRTSQLCFARKLQHEVQQKTRAWCGAWLWGALAGLLAPIATPKPPCVPNLNHLCRNTVPLVAQKMSFGPLVLPRANPKPVRSFLRCSQVSRNLFEYMRPLLKDQNDPKENKQVSKQVGRFPCRK